jgi:putative phosphoribosyl transferase
MPSWLMSRYRDRAEAGRVLAEAVRERGPYHQPVVLALPRGGVPVAVAVAAALSAPLAVLAVRKIGAPGRPELAIGAVARVGSQVATYRNAATAAAVGVDDQAFARAAEQARLELERRDRTFVGAEAPPLTDADVVLVDDGLATGSTMLAAVSAVRALDPARVVVAVPVAPASAVDALSRVADAVVCPRVPTGFLAVGGAYADFAQLSDDEVIAALAERR